MRAAQVLTLGCNSFEEVDQRFGEFRQSGITTVIIRVFHNPGDGVYGFARPRSKTGVYFKTSVCPVVDDILGHLCILAHKNDLRIYAWMTTRKAGYGITDPNFACVSYNFATGKAKLSYGLSPLIPESRAYLTQLFSDLAEYPIDGVLLQDDLILRHNEGFHRSACLMYYAQTGKRPDPAYFYNKVRRTRSGRWVVGEYTQEFREWTRWRNARILDLVEHLRGVVQSRHPGIPLGMNMYYETITNPEGGLFWFSQDLSASAGRDIDFFAIMLYHRQMQKELGLTSNQVFDLIDGRLKDVLSKIEPERLLIKLQTVDWDTRRKVPGSELEGLFRLLGKYEGIGLAVIPSGKHLDLQLIARYYKL